VIVKEEVIKEVEKVVVATPSLFDAQEILAASDGRRGGTLRVVSQASIGTIDPISSSAWVAWAVSSQIYDVPFAADGAFQPQLQMLEDWSISADGLVWSFTIRDGLQWHDGDPVTAEDFKATLLRAFDSYYTGWQELGKRVTVEVVDDKTWTLNFEEPFGLVLDSMSFNTEGFPIQKASVIGDTPAERGGGVLQEHIGSGPYQFVSWDVGNRLILERFDVQRRQPRIQPRQHHGRWRFLVQPHRQPAGRGARHVHKPLPVCAIRRALGELLPY
jgi:peptide/nickel transport system substrate-binding protein